jgi:hypothetical protein
MELDPYHTQPNHRYQSVVKLISTPKKRANIQDPGSSGKNEAEKTHELKKEVNCCAGGAGRPSASVAGRNSNVASMFAIANHSMSRAKNRPGQTRRPNPNSRSECGSSVDVTGSKKRSGLNFIGSGYVAGSWRIALNYQMSVSEGYSFFKKR